MRNRPGRLAAASTVTALALVACGSVHGTGRVAARSAQISSAPTATTVPVVRGVPSTTEPIQMAADAAHIHNLLVGAADLPGWLASAPAIQSGDANAPLSPCGQPVLPLTSALAQATASFDGPGSQLHLVEQVATYNIGQAADLVTLVRQVGQTCHRFDQISAGKKVTLVVTPTHPPAVGEDVAGLQLAGSGRFLDLAIIRSGPVDAAVLVSDAAGISIPAGTVRAAVMAAGVKLAKGLGG